MGVTSALIRRKCGNFDEWLGAEKRLLCLQCGVREEKPHASHRMIMGHHVPIPCTGHPLPCFLSHRVVGSIKETFRVVLKVNKK